MNNILFHGSPRKVGELKPRSEHGDPRLKSSVFATPSETFALAYAGKKWGDRDLEQSTRGGNASRMILREMRPGALKEIYGGRKGYVYEVPSKTFTAVPGRRTSKEVVSTQPVRPIRARVVPNVLEALERTPNVELHKYDANALETRIAIKRQVKRMSEMDDGGKGYLKWRLKPAPPEAKQMFQEEMKKLGEHVFVTGYSGAGKTTHAQRLADELGLPLRSLDSDPQYARLHRKGLTKPGAGFNNEVKAVRANIVRSAVAERKPHVFEGTQVLVDPSLTAGHRRVLVDVPERRAVDQRVRRSFLKTHKAPRMGKEEYRRVAKDLVGLYRDEVGAFRKTPGVEVIRPGKVKDNMVAGYLKPSGKYVLPREKEKRAEAPRLYHYGPRDVDLSAQGLKTPATLSGTDALEKYRGRAAKELGKSPGSLTRPEILSALEKMRGPGGSRMASLLHRPIGPGDDPGQVSFAKRKRLYEVDYNKARKAGLIEGSHIVEETPRKQRAVPPEKLVGELSKAKGFDRSSPNLLFQGTPHAFVTLKGGTLPGEYLREKRAYDDTIFSGDPTKMMPRLRQIHKFSEFPTGYGPEDLDAMKQSPGKVKSSQGFEYAATGPNKGESVYDGPRNWRPGKIKMGAGLMSGGMMSSVGSIPSMSEQYYMRGMGESGDEENMPIELVSMAGPGAAQGAHMVQMAKRLAQRPTQRMAQRHSLREDDRARIIRGLARELEELNLKDSGLLKKPGLLSRIMEKKGQYAPSGKVGLLLSQPAIARVAKKHGLTPVQMSNTLLGEKLKEKRAYKLQGQTEVQGIPIAIENRKGSVRKGTDSDGNEWRTKMKVPYGYIKGTKGADGDEVDAFVGPDKEAPNAYVVHQHKANGKGYDEDKVILGTGSKAEAKRLYLAHYDDLKFLGPISKVSTERLKELVASKKRLVKISQVSYRAMLDELMRKEAAFRKEITQKDLDRMAVSARNTPPPSPEQIRRAREMWARQNDHLPPGSMIL